MRRHEGADILLDPRVHTHGLPAHDFSERSGVDRLLTAAAFVKTGKQREEECDVHIAHAYTLKEACERLSGQGHHGDDCLLCCRAVEEASHGIYEFFGGQIAIFVGVTRLQQFCGLFSRVALLLQSYRKLLDGDCPIAVGVNVLEHLEQVVPKRHSLAALGFLRLDGLRQHARDFEGRVRGRARHVVELPRVRVHGQGHEGGGELGHVGGVREHAGRV
mmetsp:Transcript_76653/g.153835  ORF Transcript_76653/g.153835 Transcript_76653/m.153835 type:complete len:218 (-) Transcript_76653:555-1208(-)